MGHSYVGEEHFVELGISGDLEEWSDLDTRRMHVEDEVREPLVLRHVGVSAHEQHAETGVMGAACPDLLAVHDPLVAVTYCAA